MKIFAIETSCDDTSCAIVNGKRRVLSNIVQSQITEHSKYYGIVPEIASRHHLENINALITCALEESGSLFSDIDAFAVTTGPGLPGSLLVGTMVAKTFAYLFEKPIIPINHLKAHIWANFIEQDIDCDIAFPCIVLIVSGGHTELYLMQNYHDIVILGRTRDDAVGEAFDKVAKILDLGYPGGPVIDRITANTTERINVPRPFLRGTYDFSFSGIKTAVFYMVKGKDVSTEEKHRIAASFQDAAVEVLIKKTLDAAKEYNAKMIFLSGGVAANAQLRADMTTHAEDVGITVSVPPKKFCTDNAAMVGALAVDILEKYGEKYFVEQMKDEAFLKVKPNASIEEAL